MGVWQYAKDHVVPIVLVLLITINVWGLAAGINNGRSLDEARTELSEYRELSEQLEEGLRESKDLVRECLDTIGRVEQLYTELEETVAGIGTTTESVGDNSIGLGIKSDENLRIIRELRKRLEEIAE
jgi:hypothetical protein